MTRLSDPLKYRQIEDQLVSTIESGSYQAGDKLPSESELATAFHASRSTVIRALRAIKSRGLIESRQGAGSYVTAKVARPRSRRATLGLLRLEQSGRFADSVVDQVQSRLSALLQQRESALIVHTIGRDEDPLAVAQRLVGQSINGAFIVPIQSTDGGELNQPVAEVFARAGRPVVLLDSDFVLPPQRSEFDLVGIENRHCGYLQTQHLLSQGLRRIAYLGASPAVPNSIERQAGFEDAMRAAGVAAPADLICGVGSDEIDEAFVASLLKRLRPEAIVCKSDEFSALIMRHLPKLGVRVPEDLKLVGFDDRPVASLLPVGLTTIRQPVEEMALAALTLMDARLRDPTRAPSRVQLAGKLVVRQSSSGISAS